MHANKKIDANCLSDGKKPMRKKKAKNKQKNYKVISGELNKIKKYIKKLKNRKYNQKLKAKF